MCLLSFKGYLARHSYQRKSKAIRTIQRYERGRRGRKIYQVLLEEKKLREKKRLEAAIVIQTYTRGWAARKMFKVRTFRASLNSCFKAYLS